MPHCGVRWLPYGPNALMIYFADDVGEVAFHRGRAVTAALTRRPPFGLREFSLAFTSVVLEFQDGMPPDGEAIVATLQHALDTPITAPPPNPKLIRVRYDGPDLARVAEHAGLTVAEVVDRHTQPVYRVYSLGFAPGFPYLGDLDPRLRVPRLASPRVRVPAGAVAIGGEHTGIYPVASPGGWNILGHTDTRMFSPEAPDDSKFLLRAGETVRFIPE